MKSKLQKGIIYLLLAVLIIAASYIFIYYLLANDITDLRSLPTSFLIAIIAYILAQLIKRFIQKRMPWYNWLYYIGLIAVVIPLPLFSVQGSWVFSLTRWGSLFLIVPPLVEFVSLVKAKPVSKS